jgi:hypothetical protein
LQADGVLACAGVGVGGVGGGAKLAISKAS